MFREMADVKKRATNLEMSVAHLQHDLETLEKAVLDNTEKLDKVLSALKRLTEKVSTASEPAEQRNLEDEKPPHY